MDNSEIKHLRILIAEAEEIEDKALYPDVKIYANWQASKLKKKLLNLLFPKPEEI